jgi:hypothetical protein
MSIYQEEKLRYKFMGKFGDNDKFNGLTKSIDKALDLPAINDCFDASAVIRAALGPRLKITRFIDYLIPHSSPFHE